MLIRKKEKIELLRSLTSLFTHHTIFCVSNQGMVRFFKIVQNQRKILNNSQI